jgi:broad specificity phosphatase PhoE
MNYPGNLPGLDRWTMRGDLVIDHINLHHHRPRAAIIRHADRNHIASVTESLGVGLNEKGRRDARRFGEMIKGECDVRVFHSPALRCRETAEAIATGLISNGSRVLGATETWDLCAPYLLDYRTLEVADRLGNGFMRAWFDGELDREWILPATEASARVLRPLVDHLAEGAYPSPLDIHVSHDWEIVLLRDTLFQTSYEEEGWVDYLEGMVLVKREDDIEVMMGDMTTNVALPEKDSAGRKWSGIPR